MSQTTTILTPKEAPRRWKWWRRLCRVLSVLLLLVLMVLIGGYLYLRNGQRAARLVESLAAGHLRLKLHIDSADLTLFNGIGLSGVKVLSQDDHAESKDRKDQAILRARHVRLNYSLFELLRKGLSSVTIVADEPVLRLVEDVDQDRWAVLQMLSPRPTEALLPQPATTPTRPGELNLPQLVVRGGRVERAEIVQGQTIELGGVDLEGSLRPDEQVGGYFWSLQTRTPEGIGPRFGGRIALDSQTLASADLADLQLATLPGLMPKRVRDFLREIDLSGRIDVPRIEVTRFPTGEAGFSIDLLLRQVRLRATPIRWFAPGEFNLMRHLAQLQFDPMGGYPGHPARLQLMRVSREQEKHIELENANARVRFTQDAIQIQSLTAVVEGNAVEVSGRIDGYHPLATLSLRVRSPDAMPLRFAPGLNYVKALPAPAREVYYRFQPSGVARVDLTLSRGKGEITPRLEGSLDVMGAALTFENFRYPIRNATGALVFSWDSARQQQRLTLDNLRGLGIGGSSNASTQVVVSGFVQPLLRDSRVSITVDAKSVSTNDPALMRALPPPIRAVIDDLRAGDNHGRIKGDVIVRIERPEGPISRWSYDTDVQIHDGELSPRAFAYPLTHLKGQVLYRSGYVRLERIRARAGQDSTEPDATSDANLGGVEIDGFVATDARKVKPTLVNLTAQNVPVDEALLGALPEEARKVIRSANLTGKLDVAGTLVPRAPDTAAGGQFDFDLGITLKEGSARFSDVGMPIQAVHVTARLLPTRFTVESFEATRAGQPITGSGFVDWQRGPSANPQAHSAENLHATARIEAKLASPILVVDAHLVSEFPKPWQDAIDTLRLSGELGVDLSLQTQLPAKLDDLAVDLHVRPIKAAIKPKFFPCAMELVGGDVRLTGDQVTLTQLVVRRGQGHLIVNGNVDLKNQFGFELSFGAKSVLVDDELIVAMPVGIASNLRDFAIQGPVDLQVNSLRYLAPVEPAIQGEVGFNLALELAGNSVNPGVPMTDVFGNIVMLGHSVGPNVTRFDAQVKLDRLTLAGLEASNATANLSLLGDTGVGHGRTLLIRDVDLALAGGRLAGQGVVFLDALPLSYRGEILLRDADIAKLSSKNPFTGTLSASLTIEGTAKDPINPNAIVRRRGRGDINLKGEKIAQIPLLLGATQIASLSLPFTGNINSAEATYSLQDHMLVFDRLQLRSTEMLIDGGGSLDFNNRTVDLSFRTDTSGRQLPVIGELLRATRRELLQIRVRGSLSEPNVSAGAIPTIVGTVDEVLGAHR